MIFNTTISGGKPTIEPLFITENGTYTAPDGVDGYSPITVDVSGGMPDFNYTGEKIIVDDGDGNWRVKFLTSGTLTLAETTTVDIFLVGGGAGGTTGGGDSYTCGRGGGGGYTSTVSRAVLEAGVPYAVTVGAGGTASNGAGGASTLGAYTAAGGESAGYHQGSAGGSGGGAGYTGTRGTGGAGGSNGGNGGASEDYSGGRGQGSNTWEFGEEGTELYSGGGGAGGIDTTGARGGAGGYANTSSGGGSAGQNGAQSQTVPGIGGGKAGSSKSGGGGGGIGGGGGGGCGGGESSTAGAGAQGIVIIRNAR